MIGSLSGKKVTERRIGIMMVCVERKTIGMPTLDQKQHDTAGWLVRQLRAARADQSALWGLTGAVGSGKTTVLRRVFEQLSSDHLVPVIVSAPADQIDSAPIALLETATQLNSRGMLKREMGVISDPAARWPDKVTAITNAMDRNRDDLVILCDEPTGWYHFEESLVDGSPAYWARILAERMVSGTQCRRIVAGWFPNLQPAGRISAPRLSDGREFLATDSTWDGLGQFAAQLHDSLDEPVPDCSAWEMKLCVALSVLLSTDEGKRCATSEAEVVLAQVFDQVERRPDFGDLAAALARLTLARTDLDRTVLDQLTSGLEPLQKSLVERCFLDWNGAHASLHPQVRHQVLARAHEALRGRTNLPWKLPQRERNAVHDLLKGTYSNSDTASPRDRLESLHHELLGPSSSLLDSDARIQFVEQLEEIGHTLSRSHDHPRPSRGAKRTA